jgi:uncharacterized membrane protein YccC
MRIPERGIERWAAEQPRIRGPLIGVLWGLIIGAVAAILQGDWWLLLVAVLVGAVFSSWRINALSRALRGEGHSPYESS